MAHRNCRDLNTCSNTFVLEVNFHYTEHREPKTKCSRRGQEIYSVDKVNTLDFIDSKWIKASLAKLPACWLPHQGRPKVALLFP